MDTTLVKCRCFFCGHSVQVKDMWEDCPDCKAFRPLMPIGASMGQGKGVRMTNTPRDPATKYPAIDVTRSITSTPIFKTQVGGDHYTRMAIQPIEYALANSMTFIEANVVKYVSRWRFKGGVQDLKKAQHMLGLLIAHEEQRVEGKGE